MIELSELKMMPVSFYSVLDESMLWQALESMPCVSDLRLVDQGYAFSVNRSLLDWNGFKDLMGLYIRYRVNLSALEAVCPDGEVSAWFLDPARDWHAQLRP